VTLNVFPEPTTLTAGDVAHDAVDSGNPLKIGLQARTTDPTASVSARRVNAIGSTLGKQVVLQGAVPDLTWQFASAAGGVVNTADVALKAAVAGTRNYLCNLTVVNSHATVSTEVIVKDGAATVIFRGWAQAAGGGFAVAFNPPLRGTANTALNVAEITATATAGVVASASGYQAAD